MAVATFVKANKLVNKKVSPWPKRTVCVQNALSSTVKNSVFALVPQEADRPYVKTVGSGEADWIAKFIFISEKADLLSYCVCLPVLGLQRAWWHAC